MIDRTQSYLIKPQRSTPTRCSSSQQLHNLHSSVTENLQTYTDMKEELISMWQLNTVYTIPFCVIHKRYYPIQTARQIETAQSPPFSVYSSAESSNTECMSYSSKFLTEQWIRNAWSGRLYCFENRLNCCEVRKVDDNDNNEQNVWRVTPCSLMGG